MPKSTRAIAKLALAKVRAIWPETKTCVVLDSRDAQTGSKMGIAGSLLTDEDPWPRGSGGRFSLALHTAFDETSNVDGNGHLVDKVSDICRPLQAICAQDQYSEEYADFGSGQYTREGNEIKVYRINCLISTEPNFMASTSAVPLDGHPGYEPGGNEEDDRRMLWGVLTPATSVPNVDPGMRQFIYPARMMVLWYEIPGADIIHKLMRSGDLDVFYDAHIPKLYDMFENYAKDFYQFDALGNSMVDAVPPVVGQPPVCRRQLYPSEFYQYIWKSKFNKRRTPWGEQSPPFKIHRVLRITQSVPKLKSSAAYLMSTGLYFGGTTGVIAPWGADDPNVDTLNTLELGSNLAASSYFTTGLSTDVNRAIQSKRKWYDFSLNMHGAKISYYPGIAKTPEDANPEVAHSAFGQCRHDLRLGVITTHKNAFWRLRVDCSVDFFG